MTSFFAALVVSLAAQATGPLFVPEPVQGPPLPPTAPATEPGEVAVDGAAGAAADVDEGAVKSAGDDGRLALRFADHLFGDGDYYRAISEYRRYLFVSKGRGDDAPRAALAIGEALARGEQWDAAGRQLDGVATRTLDMDVRRTALFGAARAYLEDGRPELAKPRFRLLVADPDAEPMLQQTSRMLLGWGHFDAGEIDKAREVFSSIAASDSPFAKDAAGVVASIDKRGELDTKDPIVAALLSIVPGAGHMYLGQWGTGFTSLAWNTLFIVAAVSAWLSGDWGVAAVLTFAELGWYSGSMFGAVAGAFRHNRDVIRNWRDETIATHGGLRGFPELPTVEQAPPGALIRFRGTF
ncbi:MAG TPA: tetratricopeptide repeat protein [Myxococcota bacterium]